MANTFTYQPYSQPFAGSIADLLARQGDIQAQAAQSIGQVQGRAAELRGQAFGQAAQGAGQDLARPLAEIGSPAYQLDQVKLAQAKRQFGGVQALAASYQRFANDPEGQVDYLSKLGYGDIGHQVAITNAEMRKAMLDAQKEGLDVAGQQQIALQTLMRTAGREISAKGDPEMVLGTTMAQATHQYGLDPNLVATAFGPALQAAHGGAKSDDLANLLYAGTAPKMASAAPGSVVYDQNTGQPITSVPNKPIVVPPGGSLVQPPPATVGQNGAPPTAGAPRVAAPPAAAKPGQTGVTPGVIASVPPKTEAVRVEYHGKQVYGNRDPLTGKIYYLGKDVTPDVVQTPPVQVQIQGQIGAAMQHLPPWASDASGPGGPAGNVVDPTLGLTPNGLYQQAILALDSGRINYTRGTPVQQQLVNQAIYAKIGAIAADAHMDAGQFMAAYAANKASLTAQQKYYDAAQAFLQTADKNGMLLQGTLAKVGDLGSPVFNKPLRAFETSVKGDPNLSQFATYLRSVQNEYAKIITNPNLAGQLTDAARTESEQLLDPKATVPQIVASLRALNAEGNNRLASIGDQLRRIMERTGKPGATTNTTQTQTPDLIWNPATQTFTKPGGGQ